MFRTVPLSIIRSSFAVHSAMVYVIQVCRQLSSRSRMFLLESCLPTGTTYTIAECAVNELLMMDRGTVRNMQSFKPKQICEISASGWFYLKKSTLLLQFAKSLSSLAVKQIYTSFLNLSFRRKIKVAETLLSSCKYFFSSSYFTCLSKLSRKCLRVQLLIFSVKVCTYLFVRLVVSVSF